jgi:CoA:oxalate CoA-transferase
LDQPLAGLRVIEVGGTLAAAGATKTFSDYGADVIKVEPRGGAEMRRLPPFLDDLPGLERGAYHLALDTGKRSIVLDTDTPSGLDVLARIADGADLVVLQLDAPAAHAALDAIAAAPHAPSTVALSPHGLDGPFAGRTENDLSLFAWTTRMRQHAIAGREPLRYAPHLATLQWAATAAAAGIAAAWGQQHDGRARRIDVSGVEAQIGNVDNWFLIYQFQGAELPRAGGQSHLAYPAGCYPCADGYVLFASANEPFFSRVCRGIGHPELPADPRFADPIAKSQHWDDFMTYLGPWLAERTRDEAFTELQRHGVMVAPVLDVSEVLTDRQAVARGSFVEVAQHEAGTTTLAGPPFRLADAWRAGAAPRVGADTAAVLTAAGYSRDEQIALFRAGVTG